MMACHLRGFVVARSDAPAQGFALGRPIRPSTVVLRRGLAALQPVHRLRKRLDVSVRATAAVEASPAPAAVTKDPKVAAHPIEETILLQGIIREIQVYDK
jgi:hypothetical protein